RYLETAQTVQHQTFMIIRTDDKKQHQDGYSTPSPCSPTLHSLPIDNSFVVEEDEDETIIIDVDGLCFNYGDPENDPKIIYLNYSGNIRMCQLLPKNDGQHILLDEVYQQFKPVQQTELDSECKSNFRKVIKQATKESRRSVIKSLLAELTNDQMEHGLRYLGKSENVADRED
ncbi:4572_t:CDS:2, partial [Paraglomus occultum]